MGRGSRKFAIDEVDLRLRLAIELRADDPVESQSPVNTSSRMNVSA